MTEITDNTAPQGQVDAGIVTAPVVAAPETPKTWYDNFADEDKGYLQNKGWNNDDGTKNLLTSYKNLEKLRGVPEDRLLKLPESTDTEGWGRVYEKLGRPEKPEGYEYKAPEGVEIDSDRLGWASNIAHKIGLNKGQYKDLVENTVAYENEIVKSYEQRQEQERVISFTKLKDEWGSAYEERKNLAERGLARFMTDKSEEAIAKLQASLGHAEVMKMFASIGESISEDKIPSADGVRPFGYSPAQAKSDIDMLKNELAADKERLIAYNSGKGADYEKMHRLLKIAVGA